MIDHETATRKIWIKHTPKRSAKIDWAEIGMLIFTAIFIGCCVTLFAFQVATVLAQ